MRSFGRRNCGVNGGGENMKKEKEYHICWQCGKKAPVNASGVCEDCWTKFAYLRDKK